MCLGKMLDKEKNKGIFQQYLANINVRWGGFELSNLQKMRFEDSEQDRYGLQYGDLIICEGGEPGRCAIWRSEIPDLKIQKALHRVRINSDYCNEFIYYRILLAGRNGELSKHFIGSTIKHLTGVGLKQVEFLFPSLDVQRKIAGVLRSLDAKIDLNNKINTELEAMAKHIYEYWFVQFDFPEANGNPYKSSGGKMIYNKDLKREIPEDWEVVSLDYLVNIVTGNVSPKDIDSNTPYIGLEHIPRKTIVLSEWETAKKVNSDKCTFKKNDILFGKIRPYFHKVGIAFVNGITSTDTIVLRPKKKEFFGLATETVSTDLFIESATQTSTGTKMPRANWTVLKNYKVAIPSFQLLNKYQSIIDSIIARIESSVHQNRKLTELRDWLLPMLMNGQVTVAEAKKKTQTKTTE